MGLNQPRLLCFLVGLLLGIGVEAGALGEESQGFWENDDPSEPRNYTLIRNGIFAPGYGQISYHVASIAGGAPLLGAVANWQIARLLNTSLCIGYGSVGLGGPVLSYQGPVVSFVFLPSWRVNASVYWLGGRGSVRREMTEGDSSVREWVPVTSTDLGVTVAGGITGTIYLFAGLGSRNSRYTSTSGESGVPSGLPRTDIFFGVRGSTL